MRRVILETLTPPVVTTVTNPQLTKLRDLCPEYAKLPAATVDNQEVLVKNPNAIGGYTYIFPNYTYKKYGKDGNPATNNPIGSLKVCPAAAGLKPKQFGPDQEKMVQQLITSRGYVRYSDEIIGKIPTIYKPIDLYTIDPQKFNTPNTWFLYEKAVVESTRSNVPDSVEKFAKEQGVSFNIPASVEEQYKNSRKLGERAPLLLKVKTVVDWAAKQYPGVPLGDVIVYEVAPKEGEKTFNPANKEACKIKIKELYKLSVCNQKPEGRGNCSAQLKQMGSELDKLKRNVAGCLTNSLMFRQFMGIGLKKEVNVLGNTESPDYDNQLGVGREIVALRSNAAGEGQNLPVNESYDRHLKNLVRENLMILSNKKKSTITNKKVVREHFLKIVNSNLNKTDKINRIVTEGYLMINSGVNENLINEEFGWLSNLLGLGGKGIITTFKTNIIKKLINKFIPGGSDSWLGGIVANSIGAIPLGDYFNGNILKCDFVSDAITRGVTTEVLTKVQQNKDLKGGFYDVIKNSLAEYIDDTPFFNKLQKGISDMICPYMDDISGSLGKAFSNLGGDIKKEFTGGK
jgi:hypothetical protein